MKNLSRNCGTFMNEYQFEGAQQFFLLGQHNLDETWSECNTHVVKSRIPTGSKLKKNRNSTPVVKN